MTKPTPYAALYAWHTEAMNDISLHLLVTMTSEPECGWFKRKLVTGGPFVPAKIWMYQPTDENGDLVGDEVMQCEVHGQYADPQDAWPWLCGNPITEQDFNYLTALLSWSKDNAPDEPMANVKQKIDWMKVPTPTFEKETTS